MNRTLRTLAIAPFACLLFSGCRVSEHKDGGNDNVDIGTPFGSMHVKTNNSANTSAIGFAAYPGAVPIKDDGDKDGDSADVNLSFGNFHLGVKAASFQTSDQPDKVLAFYRKDLAARYGNAIECRGSQTIGSPTHTPQGLTCGGKHDNISGHTSSDDNLELRSGAEQHQHIVSVEAHNGGTKIGLVSLDLPSDHDGGNKQNAE